MNFRLMSIVASGLLAILAVTTLVQANSTDELIGLWEAKLHFGPEVQGKLVIERTADGWRASIAGLQLTAPVVGEWISFELANDKGGFRGRLNAQTRMIDGDWIQPRTKFNGTVYASPVRLSPQGAKRWQGEIAPMTDAMTLYLKLEAGEKSEVRAFLRNPERNVGIFANLTRALREGNVVRLMGKQGEGEAVKGSYDPLSGTMSFPIPPLGGTYVFKRSTAASGFYPRGEAGERYVYRTPAQRNDGWAVAPLEAERISRPAIESFVQMLIDMKMDSVHASEIHAFLVARRGRLVAEEYFHGFNGDILHDTRSASKSITAVLAGAAQTAGYKISSDTPVYAAMNAGVQPAGLEPRKQAMRLEHLLTMTSGLDCDDANSKSPGNEDVMQNQDKEPDWYGYTLALPMVAQPGSTPVYCSGGANLVGGVLNQVTGESLTALFSKLVAQPLAISRYTINLMPTGEAYSGGGLHILPRDFMKIGQLILNRGRWNGQQILSEAWVSRATSSLNKLRDMHYGYLWWGADLPYNGRTVRAIYAGGNGGQVLMIIPKLDLVVGFFGGNYADPVLFIPQRVFVPKHILPAVGN